MFHGKPLYVAIAQKKEERQAQLQLQFSQGIAGLAVPPAAVIPAGYPPLYYTAPSTVVPQQGLMYQPLGLRPEWRTSRFVPPATPAFRSVSRSMVRGKNVFKLKFLLILVSKYPLLTIYCS